MSLSESKNSIFSLVFSVNDEFFNNNGFYKWSKANKFEIGENGHPLEKAHHSAFNYIEENYDFDKYTKSNP